MNEITAQELYEVFMQATTLAGKPFMDYQELPGPAKIGWETVAIAVREYIADGDSK